MHLKDFTRSEASLLNPEQLSQNYRLAAISVENQYADLKSKIEKDYHQELRELLDNCTSKEVEAGIAFYNRGFTDGVNFILQALINTKGNMDAF